MIRRVEVAVIGAGMAGASLAAELSGRASVLLIEAESHPGRHSTGRSAAFWSESYGGPLVQPLTTASGPFLADPPEEFSATPFLRRRGAIHLADRAGTAGLDALERDMGDAVRLRRLDRAALEAAIPGLCEGWRTGLAEPSCADIDVAGLHAAYLRQARRSGAGIVTDAGLEQARRDGDGWHLKTTGGEFRSDILVDAAGAWADDVAVRAGVRPLGIRPYRRTIAQVRIDPPAPAGLPLVIDAAGRFYFKPEAGGRLWLSPHDETPCAPCDCAPEQEDVALAIDQLGRVVRWRVERVEHSWAGLRSFATDRGPVYGFDPAVPGFFWFAGQGGFGIQTAPAAAKLAAALILGTGPDPLTAGIAAAPYSPARFG